jgi:hypothetical protein
MSPDSPTISASKTGMILAWVERIATQLRALKRLVKI